MGCSGDLSHTASIEDNIKPVIPQIIKLLKDPDPSIQLSGENELIKLADQRRS